MLHLGHADEGALVNLLTIFQRFPDQEACLAHWVRVDWSDEPRCPHCASGKVACKADNLRIGRWTCHVCKSSFNVLAGTLFKKTRVPLQRWFMAMGIPINAKKSLSRHQLARDLGLTQPAALRLQRLPGRGKQARLARHRRDRRDLRGRQTAQREQPQESRYQYPFPPETRPRHP
ncbi:MAG: hypothetical protein M2R45_04231 [Verrucomicrobia subdivision 3 bacterium]|nr:hypothetical protein [Limisphaerales bacterium]MCS1412644.1 hypothetical protein [Limisphaerales bacterium]